MELEEESLDGHWSTNNNTGMEFFIINDAIFTKLCILGEDVEPCFEGARITAPEVSNTFTKMDESFKKTLFTMMQDLQSALKGGYKMELEDNNTIETEVTETPLTEEEVTEVEESVEAPEENAAAADETDISIEATQTSQEEYTATEEENKEESENNEDAIEEEIVEENNENDYALLKQEHEELKTKFAEMEEEYQKLVAFKKEVEDKEKDALIKQFYMLTDEDKKDVIENKSNYSLDEIEAKLSVICVRKKVNFDLENSSKNEDKIETEKDEEVSITYSLNNTDSAVVPAFIQALRNNRDSKEQF